jgi:hypothetical protein
MIKFITAALAFALAGFATPAMAQNVTAADPQGILKVFESAGFKATLDKGDDGKPMIRSTAENGSSFILFFLTCDEGGKNCKTLQFYAGYKDKTTLAKINSWNAESRFARAYQSDAGDSRIEMDIDVDMGGISAALMKDNLEVWAALMARFEQHLTAK